MTNKMDIDKLTKEIFKNSYLELTNPDFNAKTMKKIVHESYRRRVINSILMFASIFATVDALILLFLKFTGINILNVANGISYISTEMLDRAERLGGSIIGESFIPYLALSLGGLIVIFIVVESKLNPWKGGRLQA